MFGSKILLIAFVVGVCGLELISSAALSEMGSTYGGVILGMLLISVSALFGGFLAGLEAARKQTTSAPVEQ
jgi:hypothetical protein